MIATETSPQARRGVLVVRSDGRQPEADGIARRPGMAERMLGGWDEARQRQHRLFSIEAPDGAPVVVLALTTPETTFLLAMEREGRDPLFELAGSVECASDILAHFLTNPYEALFFVDRGGVIRYVSPVHERFLGQELGSCIGRHATEVVENTRLHETAATGKTQIAAMLQVRGVTRVVSRHPIRDPRGEIVGAIGQLMFKGPEALQAIADEMTRLRSEVAHYRRELKELKSRNGGLEQMVGESLAMQTLKRHIAKVAPLDVPVLFTGESGTGKELAAHAIHQLSSRHDADMVVVNAAAIPSTLVESELFGYEAGSFTGAERKGRRGKIEQADRSTLFFDEVGDMPPEVQVKLLRVLQDGNFQRVGGSDTRRSNFRLISASNRDFKALIADGRFRLDLFYRIGGVTIRLPSLRERLEDIPTLAQLALDQFAERHAQPRKTLSPEALEHLARQRWPGNVRQLMHCVERSAIFAEGEVIVPSDFGPLPSAGDASAEVRESPTPAVAWPAGTEGKSADVMTVSSAVGQVEEQLIHQAMAKFQGNKKRVAEELGISRPYLYKRLRQMGLMAEGAPRGLRNE